MEGREQTSLGKLGKAERRELEVIGGETVKPSEKGG